MPDATKKINIQAISLMIGSSPALAVACGNLGMWKQINILMALIQKR